MPDVTTAVTRDTVSASTIVQADPAAVWDYLRRPANHPEINGDRTVRAATGGPETLAAGDRFGMSMKLGLPYRISNKVTEFEDGRTLAWTHIAGHTWRWEVEPAPDGATKLTETFDLSTAKVPPMLRLLGFPGKHEDNVRSSVANVAAHFAG